MRGWVCGAVIGWRREKRQWEAWGDQYSVHVAADSRSAIENCDNRLAVAGSAVWRCWIGRVCDRLIVESSRLLRFVTSCRHVWCGILGMCAAGLPEREADLIFNTSQCNVLRCLKSHAQYHYVLLFKTPPHGRHVLFLFKIRNPSSNVVRLLCSKSLSLPAMRRFCPKTLHEKVHVFFLSWDFSSWNTDSKGPPNMICSFSVKTLGCMGDVLFLSGKITLNSRVFFLSRTSRWIQIQNHHGTLDVVSVQKASRWSHMSRLSRNTYSWIHVFFLPQNISFWD